MTLDLQKDTSEQSLGMSFLSPTCLEVVIAIINGTFFQMYEDQPL